MTNIADPDQSASTEANWSGTTMLQRKGISGFSRTRFMSVNHPWSKSFIINVFSDNLMIPTYILYSSFCNSWQTLQSYTLYVKCQTKKKYIFVRGIESTVINLSRTSNEAIQNQLKDLSTVLTLNNGTPYLFTILILEQVHFTVSDLSKNCCMSEF